MEPYRQLTPRAHAELVTRSSLLTGTKHTAEATRLLEEGRVGRKPDDPTAWEVIGRSTNRVYVIRRGRCPCNTTADGQDAFGYAHLCAIKLYQLVAEQMEKEHQPMFVQEEPATLPLGPTTADERLAKQPQVTPQAQAQEGHQGPRGDTKQDDPQGRAATERLLEPVSAQEGPETQTVFSQSLPPLHRLRSLHAILTDLRRPVPAGCIAQKPASKTSTAKISYLHWTTVARILDQYAPGWEGRVRRVEKVGDKWAVTYRLTIHAQDGSIAQEDVAMEDEDRDDVGYGDTMTNALAAAFKRAAAKLGVGRQLYEKDETDKVLAHHFQHETLDAWTELGQRLDARGMSREQGLQWLLTQTGTTKKRDVPLSAIRYLAAQLASDEDA
jgi:hypothetical protein